MGVRVAVCTVFFISININFSFLCFYSARRARPDEDSDDEGLLAKLAYVFMKNNFFSEQLRPRKKRAARGGGVDRGGGKQSQ